MRKVIVFLSFILVLISSCENPGELFEDAICITNISTIDSKDGLQKNKTVIIRAGKIEKITATSDLKLSPQNKIIDGTGKFLIPGLWDAHVHFAYMEDLAPSMFNLFLHFGITSVRDTGGKIDFVKKWKDKSLENPTTAPRVMITGPLMDGMPNVYDGSTPERPPLSIGTATVEESLVLVEQLDSIGVDHLKAYEMLSPEQFVAITDRAKEKGLKVTGHVPLSMDVITASNAGLNSMEHLRNLEMSTAKNADELLAQRIKLLELGKNDEGGVLRSNIHASQRREAIDNTDPEQTQKVLSVLAKNDTWQIPTFMVMTSFVEQPFGNPEWQETFEYLPEAIEQKWIEGTKQALSMEVSEDKKKYRDWFFDMVGQLHKSEVELMAGTDCPIFFLTPGYTLHEELRMLVKAGLTPAEALKTATYNPAKYFDMENELGLVAEGMIADLLILNANPLEDISNTKKINAVFKQGNLFDRQALDNLLAK